MSRPALGYLSVPADAGVEAPERDVARLAALMRGHATEHGGYDLTGVFLDVCGVTDVGLYCVLAAVRCAEAVAVVVPGLVHLRHVGGLADADPRTAQRYLRARVLTLYSDCGGRPRPPRHAHPDRYAASAARAIARAGRR